MAEHRREPSEPRVPSIGSLAVLPVFFDLSSKRAVVAGGGAPAAWKAELLAAAGARVAVYADPAGEEMTALAEGDARVELAPRAWRPEDLVGAAIAVGEIEDDESAASFARAAKEAGTPVNVIDRPEFCSFQFGSIVERSPLVVGISTGAAAPALAQAARARIEAVLPQALRAWADRAAAWRPALRSRRLDSRSRRRFWSRFAARAFAAREDVPAAQALDALVEEAQTEGAAAPLGSVTLVGAGPGDPELLTLKAVRALQSADVVLFDDLASPETVASARREAQKITVGKRGYKPSCTQEDITALMVELAREGKRVVRLKGGDPMLFGRANEELNGLRAAGIPCDVVPGVTAASAAAAALRRSLTERDLSRRVQFITAHARNGRLPDDLNWRALADPRATTAVYMGVRTLPELVARLLAEGLPPDTPAALVENVSRPDERRASACLGDLPACAARLAPSGPCLVLFGRALTEGDPGEREPLPEA